MNRINCSIMPLIQRNPQAAAIVTGSEKYPDIHGSVRFYNMKNGTLVYSDVNGLPYAGNRCSQEIFGFHIHGGDSCTGNAEDPLQMRVSVSIRIIALIRFIRATCLRFSATMERLFQFF